MDKEKVFYFFLNVFRVFVLVRNTIKVNRGSRDLLWTKFKEQLHKEKKLN